VNRKVPHPEQDCAFHTSSVPPDRNTSNKGLLINPAALTYTSERNNIKNTVSLTPRHTHVADDESHHCTYRAAIGRRHMALPAAPRIGHR